VGRRPGWAAHSEENGVGACKGLRVIEMGAMVTAPLAAQILADLGAEVIKVEPLEGEVMRSIPPVYNGVSAAFAQWNRNKKSVTLNLKTAEGAEAARKLVASADVLITNYRPKVLKAFQLDYEPVARTNPGIVYAALSGFGPTGPYSDQPAYDMVMQALTGFMPVQGGKETPMAVKATVVDKITGYSAALSVLAALLHRAGGGGGQLIDISMMDAYASFMLPETLYATTFLDAPPSKPWTADLYNTVKLKDGRAMGFIMTDGQFKGACETFGLQRLMTDPRFANPGVRNLHMTEMMQEISAVTEHMTRDEFVILVRKHEVPFSPVNDLEEFQNDPQAIHNETFVEFTDERVGRVSLLNSFARFAKTPVNAKALPPEKGAHNEEIFRELGLDAGEIDALKAKAPA
jgi:crotonobetainyl-CoA:carnitine CoA-transferase CaiB-like acyl-CoA transferase